MRRLFVALAFAGVLLGLAACQSHAGVLCWGEASVGKNITSTEVKDAAGPITISADGLQGGVGAGCDYTLSETITVGMFARYDVLDIDTHFGSGSLGGDGVWSAAVRAGIKINPGTLIYGLGGIAGTELTYPGLSTSPQGILMGAGLEIDLAIKNLSFFAEYDRIQWSKSHLDGGTLKPDSDVFRVGLRLKFDLLK